VIHNYFGNDFIDNIGESYRKKISGVFYFFLFGNKGRKGGFYSGENLKEFS
jgi:hypothetical protein